MDNNYKFIFLFLSLLSYCSCEISYEKKNKLVNGFIDFYNSLPNQIYTCEEGYLQNAQQSTELNSYIIEVTLKVSEYHNIESKKYLRCTGKVVDLDVVGISVLNHHCEDTSIDDKGGEVEEIVVTETSSKAAETPFVRKPVQLDNEVQTNTAVTSGEQFIAIPREEPKVSCIGCSSHVNPQAPGVSELASIGVRQLNSLEPNIQHTLNSVVDVERQVQVVNGIRYILTLIIDYNSCLTPETDTCLDSKTCKITFLEKPWMLLPDGSKYRAILANNCTKEWRFGDDGVVVPQTPGDSREKNNINLPQTDGGSDIIKPVHNVDVQAQQHIEKTLTDDDIKVIEDQIIPHKNFEELQTESTLIATSEPTETSELGKEHAVKVESDNQLSPNSISATNTVKIENLTEDKKKAIDDMLSFFSFAGFESVPSNNEKGRMKRSFDNDLNVMNLVENFKKVKKNIENAKHVYKLAQNVVDYLNEIDIEVKTRVLKDVINAEEEFENHQHFYYIQSRVIIPCDKSECEEKDTIVKICNAVLDGTNANVRILNAFCHDEPTIKPLGKVNTVALDDPVLLKLVKEATNKIESESAYGKAMRVNKIIAANTQRVSGILTKFSILLDHTNCNRTEPLVVTKNCSIAEELGSQVCDVTVHERHWLKERKVTYVCTERPIDSSFSNIRNLGIKKNVNDPAVLDMANEALQYLDVQSNRNNKQIVVRVTSVTTQLVAGFLTDIEFVVGYTTCTNDVKQDNSKCKLLKDEPLRTCKAKVWDRTWIEDGRQVDVSCEEPKTKESKLPKRIKRETQFVGGAKSTDVNSPEIKALAKDALRIYLKDSVYNRHFDILDIKRATVQVVAGTLTEIEFSITPTTCLIDREGYPGSSDCKIIDYKDVTTCTAKIWEKPWIKFKNVNTTCHANNRNNREKRALLGGLEEQNTNDPKYKALAEESMQKYLQSNCNTKLHKVIKINKVKTQVVSGSKTIIDFEISPVDETNSDVISCRSEIWEQLWLKKKEITVNCGIEQSKTKRDVTHESYTGRKLLNFEAGQTHQDVRVKIDNREKRGLPGGETEQNTSDPRYKLLAEESMRKYLESNGNTKQHEVIKINKVKTQVVSGSKTIIDFEISPVDETNSDVISCHSEIWEQPWLKKKEITVNCGIEQSKTKRETHESYTGRKLLNFEARQTHQDVRVKIDNREKRELPGGETEQNTSDPRYKLLAEESMRKYLESNGNTKQHEVIKINTVTTQVVSGSKTKIDFVISPVDRTNSDVISCHSEIWEQLWLKKKEITVNCGIEQSKTKRDVTHESYTGRKLLNFEAGQTHQDVRVKTDNREKRGLPGGETEQDTSDPRYKLLAEESMRKYLESNGNTEQHEVIKINTVTTQVVSGSKTKIDFVISPVDRTNSDVISCHSEIWEQLWLKKKEITVNCGIEQPKTKREIIYDEQSRSKREILYNEPKIKSSNEKNALGGLQEHDPTKTQYRELARETLKKFLKIQKKSDVHKVVEVKKVTSRVVSGIMYYIEYIAAPASCAKDISTCVSEKSVLLCDANVWDRPWLGKKEINVDCKANKKRKPRSLELRDVEDTFHEEEHREKRQTQSEEEYVDEDLSFYYADLAIRHLNDQLRSNNLHKLVSIHSAQNSVQMNQPMVRMYIETAETFCLRHKDENILPECEELDGIAHRVCLARLWPSPDDELVVQQVNLVCDDDKNFESLTGLSVPAMVRASIKEIEKSPNIKFKLVPQGEVQMTPSLDSSNPITLNFIVASTNCSKDIKLDIPEANLYMYNCYIDLSRPTRGCQSYIWLAPNSKNIQNVAAECNEKISRKRRTVSLNPSNSTVDELIIQNMVQESLHKLEMASSHRYKQRVLNINSYSTKITSGKVTTIDFDVGYTSCLKFEWVDDLKTCEFLEHLPRKHCVSQVWERLWLNNGRNIEVTCEEDETPLEAHVEFESAETAKILANEALRHIEAKYPNPRKQKVVRIFSLEKQVVAGIHYRMKVEVGPTQCLALSAETNCILDKKSDNNKFCRVNVWLRPWTDHPPSFRVTCDYQEGAVSDMHHLLQAEQLFSAFLAMYKPEYINNASEMKRRFEIFRKNIRKIHELNTHEKGTATYGVTRFADLSYEEFSEKFLGLKPSLRDKNQVPMREAEIPDLQVPEKFDWREYGAVTEVKDQGSCGSCWAFSVTGNIEGQWKMQSGQLVSLSEQELVDCDKLDSGCNGGLPDNAYRAIEQLGGLELENDYPYEGEDDKCSFNKTMSKVQISGAVNITSNETDMAKWLVHNGPISIGINANAMQFYMGGVSHPWKMLCNPTNLDHGVLIVGYGVKDYPLFHKRLPFWTIKNSWGPGWGEKGYYRVFRGDGTCGVNQMASSAVI